MASAFTTNLNLEKPATGDQQGAWGVTLNANLDKIDALLSGTPTAGAIALRAGGTNQNVTITPSGTGKTLIGNSSIGSGYTIFPSNNAGISPSNDQGLILGWNNTGGEGEVMFIDYTGLGSVPGFRFYAWSGSVLTELARISTDKSFGVNALPVSGGVIIAAGGTNQNVTLTPSGTGFTVLNGSVGIGTSSPNTTLDVNGSFSIRRAPLTLGNGDNNNIVLSGFSFLKITGPTAAFAVTGFAGGADGRILRLYNSTAQTMTIKNSNIGSAAANRILTLTGADVVLRASAQSFATFVYDSAQSLWILVATN